MTELARTLVGRYFSCGKAELRIGGVPISEIVEKFGTPIFVYDGQTLDMKWRVVRDTFPAPFAISYSVKANPNPFLLRWFLSKGCGLEIASGGEFHLARAAGCEPARLLFAGPGKSEAELEQVVSHDIGEIHVESLLEAKRVNAIGQRRGTRVRVALRVNPCAAAQGGAMQMGGKPAPFGVDEEQLDDAIDQILKLRGLEFRGLHFYIGTQILDHTILARQYRHGLEVAKRAAAKTGRPLATVDFGGGLGIPYFEGERELEMVELARELALVTNEISGEPAFVGTQFVVEPGRYLVGDAGIYVSRVNDIKTSRGKKYVVVDGGMHHHLAASGNLGQSIKRNFPVAILNKIGAEPCERVNVVGPLCTPLDVLARDVHLPFAEIGDLVGVFQSGAYARSASPLGFLSHPTPAEVIIQNGEHRLIRRRGDFHDLVADIIDD